MLRKDGWWGTWAMFTAMRPSLKDSPSKHLRNILWSCTTSDPAGSEVGRESRRWNTLEGWVRHMMIGNAKHTFLRFALQKTSRVFDYPKPPMVADETQLCVVTLINWRTYFPCIGMTIKSRSNRQILDRYLSLNFSGSWESWVQNMHGKTCIFWFGEGIWARHSKWKCLCDSDRPSITWRKQTHWIAKSIWLSDSHAVLSFNLPKSRRRNS